MKKISLVVFPALTIVLEALPLGAVCTFAPSPTERVREKLKYALGDDFAHPEMVFVSARGNYRDRNSVYQSLKRFTKGTEFEDMTLHQLRHCNATMLLNSGIDLKVVSEHLGHCDVNITAEIYADVLRKTKARTAEQIELCLA